MFRACYKLEIVNCHGFLKFISTTIQSQTLWTKAALEKKIYKILAFLDSHELAVDTNFWDEIVSNLKQTRS